MRTQAYLTKAAETKGQLPVLFHRLIASRFTFCRYFLATTVYVAVLSIFSISPAFAGSVSYTYDSLGRLVTAVYSSGVKVVTTVTYGYDSTGNWTLVATTAP